MATPPIPRPSQHGILSLIVTKLRPAHRRKKPLAIPRHTGNRNLMTQPPVLLSTDASGVATVTLNRPEVGNAYNAAMLDALIQGLTALAKNPAVRCLVIKGAGKHFQAGADIGWLGEVAHYPPAENYAASIATTRAMQLLNEFPKPTIALVHGACFGGGVGIVCCVDVAFATPDSQFGITEIRVGVAPTPISTHMVNAIGLRHTRRYALTGERFDAEEAERIGLIHEVVPESETGSKTRSRPRRHLPGQSDGHRHDQEQLPRRQQPAAGRAPDRDAGARGLDPAPLARRPGRHHRFP